MFSALSVDLCEAVPLQNYFVIVCSTFPDDLCEAVSIIFSNCIFLYALFPRRENGCKKLGKVINRDILNIFSYFCGKHAQLICYLIY